MMPGDVFFKEGTISVDAGSDYCMGVHVHVVSG